MIRHSQFKHAQPEKLAASMPDRPEGCALLTEARVVIREIGAVIREIGEAGETELGRGGLGARAGGNGLQCRCVFVFLFARK